MGFFLLLNVNFYGGIHAVLIDEKSATSEMEFLILMDQFWREKKLTVYEKKILLLPWIDSLLLSLSILDKRKTLGFYIPCRVGIYRNNQE